ncbi:MAG: hypothetical protein M3N25_03050 [Actinomycetota bacterium]|nr:hypothetical protein [Actinomycetota bacterium]
MRQLDHARARRTRAIGLVRARSAERLARGWNPSRLADELLFSRPLDDVSHLDAVLASRLDALPLDPPERVDQPTGPYPGCSGAEVWITLADGREASVCADCQDVPESLRHAPRIVVEVTSSAPETSPETPVDVHESASIEAPEAMPAHDVDQGADGDLCDVQVPAVASLGGSRKVIDVDEATGPPEPAPRPPTPDVEAMARARAAVEATRGGSRSERGRPFGAPPDEPRQAFGLSSSPERPVDARLSPSEGVRGVTAPEAPEKGADGDRFGLAERKRLREERAARLRPYGLSA